jgi:ABC-type glutathione transport system ATPase component
VVIRDAFGPDRATTTGRENDGAAVFRVERLRYRYPQATERAVYDVSFTVGEGEIFGF